MKPLPRPRTVALALSCALGALAPAAPAAAGDEYAVPVPPPPSALEAPARPQPLTPPRGPQAAILESWSADGRYLVYSMHIFRGRGPGSRIRCSIRRGDRLLASHVFVVPANAEEVMVRLLWSPDNRRIAWLFRAWIAKTASKQAAVTWEDASGSNQVVIDRAVGPRIELTGAKGTRSEEFDRVADLIEKAGFAPTGRRPAAVGPRTIIYAVSEWKSAAAAIAAALPGRPEVKPLASPRNGFEVIVALGGAR